MFPVDGEADAPFGAAAGPDTSDQKPHEEREERSRKYCSRDDGRSSFGPRALIKLSLEFWVLTWFGMWLCSVGGLGSCSIEIRHCVLLALLPLPHSAGLPGRDSLTHSLLLLYNPSFYFVPIYRQLIK